MSVGRARRLVGDVLRGEVTGELLDTALLLVSELVTNAVLHAGSDVMLTIDTDEGVRVEVADRSPALPARRDYEPDASTGRGLALVEMLAHDYGVDRRSDGKVVWFALRRSGAEEPTAEADELLERWADPSMDRDEERGGATRTIVLRSVPVHLFRAMQQHNDALLREHTLMGRGAPGSIAPPLPVDLRPLEQAVRHAIDEGEPAVDVEIPCGPDAAAGARGMLDVLAAADERAFAGATLTPAALPEIRWCRVWHLEEIAAQSQGGEPRPWAPLDLQHREADMPHQIEPWAVLEAMNDALVVGDDQNRIVYVNPAAASLLDWAQSELVGRRLTSLIPQRLHEQHLAAYTRFLVTGQARLIGRPVRVPARRRDGSELEIELLLSELTGADGRPMFIASIRDLTDRLRVERQATLAVALGASEALVALLGARQPATLESVGDAVLSELGDRLGWRVGALWAAEDDLRCIATWSADGERYRDFLEATRTRRFPRGRGLPGRVWGDGEGTFIPDVVADANFPRGDAAARAGLRGALAFPVRDGAAITGVVELFTDTLVELQPELLDLFSTIGSHLGALTRP